MTDMLTPIAKIQQYVKQIEQENKKLRSESDPRLKRRIVHLEERLSQIASLSEIEDGSFQTNGLSKRDNDQPVSND